MPKALNKNMTSVPNLPLWIPGQAADDEQHGENESDHAELGAMSTASG